MSHLVHVFLFIYVAYSRDFTVITQLDFSYIILILLNNVP